MRNFGEIVHPKSRELCRIGVVFDDIGSVTQVHVWSIESNTFRRAFYFDPDRGRADDGEEEARRHVLELGYAYGLPDPNYFESVFVYPLIPVQPA